MNQAMNPQAAKAADHDWDPGATEPVPNPPGLRPPVWRWPSRTYTLLAMATPHDEPASPCVRNCCLDAQDVCLGCGRRIDEIVRWHDAAAPERLAILARAAQRQAERGSARPGQGRKPGSPC